MNGLPKLLHLPKLRTIIAGPREIDNPEMVDWLMADCPWFPSVVISGHARGFDRLGELWAIRHGVPYVTEPCMEYEWMEYGKQAGHFRNERMILKHKAEGLCCVYFPPDKYGDGGSRGTNDLRDLAEVHGLRIHEKALKGQTDPKGSTEPKEIEDDVPF